MPLDPEIRDANRAATERIRALAARLEDDELGRPVGEHWTVAIVFAHLAFWERRALDALERETNPAADPMPDVSVIVNDLSLPLWAAIPPREATRLAIEWAEALDARAESLPTEHRGQGHGRAPTLDPPLAAPQRAPRRGGRRARILNGLIRRRSVLAVDRVAPGQRTTRKVVALSFQRGGPPSRAGRRRP